MGQIDVAHQPKDQRESAGDQEIEAAERDAVEDGVEEDLLPAEGLFKAGRPDRENEPEQRCDREDRQKCPCRMALDESGHVRNLAATRAPRGCPHRSADPKQGACHTIDVHPPAVSRPSFGSRSMHPNGDGRGGFDRQYLLSVSAVPSGTQDLGCTAVIRGRHPNISRKKAGERALR